MKKTTCTILIFLFSFLIAPSLFGSKKSEARIEIQEAFKLMKEIVAAKSLHEFIPYDNYYNSKIYLAEAKHQFDEEDEYEVASLYAILALVELKTTHIVAKTRYALKEKLLIEKDYVSNRVSKNITHKLSIAEANLQKVGWSYQRTFPDNSIFKIKTFDLNKNGERFLKRIYKVMKLYRRSKITIIGHTRKKDSDNVRSLQKAESVSSFLTKIKDLSPYRVQVKGKGNEKEINIGGIMQNIDRIEVVLTGIR